MHLHYSFHISGKTLGTSHYLGLTFSLPVNTVMTIDIAQVMFVEGSSASVPFNRAGYDYAGELLKCQRYYEKLYDLDVAPGSAGAVGQRTTAADSGGNLRFTSLFTVQKRVPPTTIKSYNPSTGAIDCVQDVAGGTNKTGADMTGELTDRGYLLAVGSITANAGARLCWAADADFTN
jgi:hypothetical protein